jgi:hypothetical protein
MRSSYLKCEANSLEYEAFVKDFVEGVTAVSSDQVDYLKPTRLTNANVVCNGND